MSMETPIEWVLANSLRRKEGSQDVAAESANSMDGKYIKRVVNAEQEFEPSTIVAGDSGHDAVDHSGPGWNKAASRSTGSRWVSKKVVLLFQTEQKRMRKRGHRAYMHTSPATTPEQNPTSVNLWLRR